MTAAGPVGAKRIVGYGDEISVLPGETIAFHVSCEPPVDSYEATIVRMRSGDPRAGAVGLRHTPVLPVGVFPGHTRTTVAGSYGVAPAGDAVDQEVLTPAVLALPTLAAGRRQVLLAAEKAAEKSAGEAGEKAAGASVTLLLDELLRPAVHVDGRQVVRGETPLTVSRWHVLVAVVDRRAGRVRLAYGAADSAERTTAEAPLDPASPGPAGGTGPGAGGAWTVVFGAELGGGTAPRHPFTGRLERPLLAREPGMARAEELLLGDRAVLRDAGDLIAAWDFAEDISSWDIRDAGPSALHGTLHNLPQRAVRGTHWQRGTTDWRQAPDEYAAVHFLADAIEDCRWPVDFTVTVPPGTPSGFYAARLSSGQDEEFVPFFVRPAATSRRASVLLVAPTATYGAYGNSRFWWESPIQEAVQDRLVELGPEEQYLLTHSELGLSSYDCHLDGTDVCYVSRLRPNLNMRPGHVRAEGYTCDLYLVDWLEHEGYEFDVVTDEDVHREGADLLARYPVVLTGTHPEYMSARIFDAFDGYTLGGGRLLYLGGNGFFMNVNFDPRRPWVMENRRVDLWERDEETQRAESYNSTDGLRGGRLGAIGRSAMAAVGVESATMGFDRSYPIVRDDRSRTPAAEFVFAGVDSEVIGDYGALGGGAIGQEWDNAAGHVPAPGHVVLGSSRDHSLVPPLFGASKPDYHGDVVLLFKGAGCVFSAGSMAWCGALSHNGYRNDISTITRNVIDRFLDPEAFAGVAANG
ncbi:N,N-dimethylformamidase beta subunit family domain-containing protein [Microbispora bryophytorum]|uniref:N,N-dimethylformamidase beta subunit family domain-containing protein n=1 Tax=Microbispora bryophytorum TaxID=1460882 RepID=UPI0033C7D009